MEILTDSNQVLYAAKYYDNPQCTSTEEFYEDLNRFRYIRRLLRKYQRNKVLKTSLILNHLIVVTNMFGPIPVVRLLYLTCKDQFEVLVPFLIFLNMFPEKIENVTDINIIYTDSFPVDNYIVQELRKIRG